MLKKNTDRFPAFDRFARKANRKASVAQKKVSRRRVGGKSSIKSRPKLKSLSKLKIEADSVFSKYIRTKFAINGVCYCYTCNKPMEFKKAQAGHFISRLYLATRWDENNARPQDAGCNIWGRGKPLEFEENLIAEIGEAKVKELKEKRKQLIKPTREFYTRLIAGLNEKLESLNKAT